MRGHAGTEGGVSCFMASKNGPNSLIKVSCLRVFDHTPPIEGRRGLAWADGLSLPYAEL